MIELAVILLVRAGVAGILGFGGVATAFAGVARVLLVVFLVLALVAYFL